MKHVDLMTLHRSFCQQFESHGNQNLATRLIIHKNEWGNKTNFFHHGFRQGLPHFYEDLRVLKYAFCLLP